MDFTPSELSVIEEAVRRGSDKFERPVWMQSQRHMACKIEVRNRLAALPPEPTTAGSGKVYYHANRRIKAEPITGRSNKIHEVGSDGLPICQMRGTFEDWIAEGSQPIELGGGPVTCGHCANARNR